MTKKLFVILVLLSLLMVSSVPAFAQGTKPPPKSNNPADLPRDTPISAKADGASAQAVAPEQGLADLVTVPTLTNGNFEQGPHSGWTVSSSNGFPIIESAATGLLITPRSGSYAAWLGGWPDETSVISQSLSVINPTHIRLWYMVGSQDVCGFDFGYLKINSAILYTWSLCDANDTTGWVPLDLDLSAYAGQTVTLTIEATLDDSLNSNLFIDDVSLYGTFADVPYDYGFWSYIEGLYNAGVTSGCSVTPSLFCPTTTVTRDQMAVFLLKGKHGAGFTPPTPSGVFADVPTNYWAAAWIEQLAAEGITSGCGSGNYCPIQPVTRDQMAVFLLKAKHGSGYVPPDATGVFQDVPVNYWAADWIEQLAAEGITAGCGGGNFCPTTPVSRDQMAVFLVKTFNLPLP